MRVVMNMETGKYDRVCYEESDLLVRRGHPDDIFLITKVKRKGRGWNYYVSREANLSQVARMRGRMELVFVFKPFMEDTAFYK